MYSTLKFPKHTFWYTFYPFFTVTDSADERDKTLFLLDLRELLFYHHREIFRICFLISELPHIFSPSAICSLNSWGAVLYERDEPELEERNSSSELPIEISG